MQLALTIFIGLLDGTTAPQEAHGAQYGKPKEGWQGGKIFTHPRIADKTREMLIPQNTSALLMVGDVFWERSTHASNEMTLRPRCQRLPKW